MTMTAERPGVLSGGEYDESPYVTQFRRVITNQLGYCDDEAQGSQHVKLPILQIMRAERICAEAVQAASQPTNPR